MTRSLQVQNESNYVVPTKSSFRQDQWKYKHRHIWNLVRYRPIAIYCKLTSSCGNDNEENRVFKHRLLL